MIDEDQVLEYACQLVKQCRNSGKLSLEYTKNTEKEQILKEQEAVLKTCVRQAAKHFYHFNCGIYLKMLLGCLGVAGSAVLVAAFHMPLAVGIGLGLLSFSMFAFCVSSIRNDLQPLAERPRILVK